MNGFSSSKMTLTWNGCSRKHKSSSSSTHRAANSASGSWILRPRDTAWRSREGYSRNSFCNSSKEHWKTLNTRLHSWYWIVTDFVKHNLIVSIFFCNSHVLPSVYVGFDGGYSVRVISSGIPSPELTNTTWYVVNCKTMLTQLTTPQWGFSGPI